MNYEQNAPLPDDGSGNPAPAETPERLTLDKVYADHKIEDDAQKFKQDEFQPLPVVQRDNGEEIINAVNAQSRVVQDLRDERRNLSVRADIDSAVATVEKETGLDKKLIEVYLDLQARDDPRFEKVWLNRKSNPKAFNAALEAVTNEIEDKFQARSDPNLLANQKAMRAYQSGSSTRQNPAEKRWDNLSQSQFSKEWNALIS